MMKTVPGVRWGSFLLGAIVACGATDPAASDADEHDSPLMVLSPAVETRHFDWADPAASDWGPVLFLVPCQWP